MKDVPIVLYELRELPVKDVATVKELPGKMWQGSCMGS